MGYYTNWTFHCDHPNADRVKNAISDASIYESPFSTDVIMNCGDGAKWYSTQKDCLSVSKQFPHVTFAIRSEGEDGDEEVVVYGRGERLARVYPGKRPRDSGWGALGGVYEDVPAPTVVAIGHDAEAILGREILAIPRDVWRATFAYNDEA